MSDRAGVLKVERDQRWLFLPLTNDVSVVYCGQICEVDKLMCMPALRNVCMDAGFLADAHPDCVPPQASSGLNLDLCCF